MVGMIDLNTTEEDNETTPSSGGSLLSSPSSSSASASVLSASNPSSCVGGSSSVCLELWHACAGPLISLPKRGSLVVYFPQGHLEQFPDLPLAAYDLPSHLFCRVVDVKLHAEADNDEVYAQVSLLPECEIEQKFNQGKIDGDGEEEDIEASVKSTTPHMFCKTLTASDTSTHGGFSVPRRAAEDCFPPLDYTQQRPSQELVAKDLHGFEWKFRHIYRGQPRRHLLTTGWSAFVNKKKLVSGDAVLFLRGDDGELRLGIRRAVQVKGAAAFPTLCSQQLNHNTLTDVVNAMSMRSVFNIYYNPRASSSEFIVPFHKFLKSLDYSFSIGMRFKMRFETEDAAERRYVGIVTGISDLDPVRWPSSKWRCLVVRWDDMETSRHSRVSPWEIEPSGPVPNSSSFVASGLKRCRSGLPSSKPEFPIPDGIGASDFGEPSRFQKVLQGQEIMSFNAPYDGADQNQHSSEMRRILPGVHGTGFSKARNGARDSALNSDVTFKSMSFGESYRFHKVLQGQEIIPSSTFGRASGSNEAYDQNGCFGSSDGAQVTGSRNRWPAVLQGFNAHMRPPTQASSPSSGGNARNFFGNPGAYGEKRSSSVHILERDDAWVTNSGHIQHGVSQAHVAQSPFRASQDLVSSCKSSCRLFGFQLTEDRHVGNKDDNPISLDPGTSYLPCVGEQFHLNPPTITNTVGSNCTKGILQQHHENFHIY
ncbi:Auxin response factor 3 [Euphorbia peplus]|nr:Auxin response factor 3 [Euphorbia peplus]